MIFYKIIINKVFNCLGVWGGIIFRLFKFGYKLERLRLLVI